ncbi:hypothetical protein HYQ45_016667 [Verticillium longisporum]|uniref:Uncharacterized protein n=1 Tax=Verticillium longisporum TaxID=100787 RepID=A0A8I2Z5K3_VERLO|nr:hypothetical protein HYQ45_016667 [Verticillium longisporum]
MSNKEDQSECTLTIHPDPPRKGGSGTSSRLVLVGLTSETVLQQVCPRWAGGQELVEKDGEQVRKFGQS